MERPERAATEAVASPWPLLRLFAVLADIAASPGEANERGPPDDGGGQPDDADLEEAA